MLTPLYNLMEQENAFNDFIVFPWCENSSYGNLSNINIVSCHKLMKQNRTHL